MNQGLAQAVVSNVHVPGATASAISSRWRQLLEWLKQSLCVSAEEGHYRHSPWSADRRAWGLIQCPAQTSLFPDTGCYSSRITTLYFLFYFWGVFITSLLVFCSIKLFLCFFNFVCKKERSLLKYIYKKGKIIVSHLLKSVLKYLFIFRSDIIHV